MNNSKKVFQFLILTLIAGSVFLGAGNTINAALPGTPEFNASPNDPSDWFTGQINDGSNSDGDPFSAEPGDELLLGIFYHNHIAGTVAENTKMRIDFPTTKQETIVLTGSITADNTSPQTIEDNLTINVSSAQKLNFSATAYWMSIEDPGNITSIPVEIHTDYVEAIRGDVGCCWTERGYVIFYATLTQDPAPTLSVSLTADPDSGEEPLNNVDLTAVVSGTATGNIDYKFDCENDGDWDYTYNGLSQEVLTITNACNYQEDGTYIAKVEVTREGLTETDTDIIEVFCNPEITVDLEVNGFDGPVIVDYGDDIRLEWESTDADSCIAFGNWSGIKGVSGTEPKYNLTGDRTYHITCTGLGGSATDSVEVLVRDEPVLYVNLIADPDHGEEPLNNVDLEAVVSGSADGDIDYKFDCENDGDWDFVKYSVNYETYTVYGVCDYNQAGTYTAKVQVWRDGLTETDTDIIEVEGDDKTLYVNLTANPDYGDEPLEDVDLKAVVSGSADGDIDYKFDCDNDGSFEYSYYDRTSETLTASNICDYDKAGTHTARVRVYRDDLTATDTDTIRVGVSRQIIEFEVDKKVRNKTDGETTWRSSTNASPSDMLAYRIIITAPDDSRLSDITLEDSMPNRIKWYGNEKINGKDLDHDMSEPLDLDDLNSGDSVEITFEVLLQEKAEFGYGATELVNRVSVDADDETESDSATIVVVKTSVAGATTVPTGALDNFWMSLGIAVLSTYTLLIVYFFYQKVLGSPSFRIEDGINNLKSTTKMRLYTADPFKTKNASEMRLQKRIEGIRKQEK